MKSILRFKVVALVLSFVVLPVLVGCGAESTETQVAQVAEAPIAEAVAPTVTLDVIPGERTIMTGEQATIAILLDPPVEINEIEWSKTGDGELEFTSDQQGAVFTAPDKAAAVFIEVTGTTVDGAPFSEKISLTIVEPTPEPTPEEPTPEPTPEEPTPEPTPEEPTPEEPTPEPTPEPLITLNGFEEGQNGEFQEVVCENALNGTYHGDANDKIWPVVIVDGIWHPQDLNGLSATIVGDMWNGVARFGNCDDPNANAGKTFQLLVVIADTRCHDQFASYILSTQSSGKFPGIPDDKVETSCRGGAEIAFSVVRK